MEPPRRHMFCYLSKRLAMVGKLQVIDKGYKITHPQVSSLKVSHLPGDLCSEPFLFQPLL